MKSLKPHPNKGESIGFTNLQISIHKLKGALTFSKELSLKVKPQILKSHGISLSQSTWSWQVYPTPSVPWTIVVHIPWLLPKTSAYRLLSVCILYSSK